MTSLIVDTARRVAPALIGYWAHLYYYQTQIAKRNPFNELRWFTSQPNWPIAPAVSLILWDSRSKRFYSRDKRLDLRPTLNFLCWLMVGNCINWVGPAEKLIETIRWSTLASKTHTSEHNVAKLFETFEASNEPQTPVWDWLNFLEAGLDAVVRSTKWGGMSDATRARVLNIYNSLLPGDFALKLSLAIFCQLRDQSVSDLSKAAAKPVRPAEAVRVGGVHPKKTKIHLPTNSRL